MARAPEAEPVPSREFESAGVLKEARDGALARRLCEETCVIRARTPVQDHLYLVTTESLAEKKENQWPEQPGQWLVEFDEAESVLKAQKLADGYAEGAAPEEGLPSTFTLTEQSPFGTFLLESHEPSPGGTAWGRAGKVLFRWPRGERSGVEILAWTYTWTHFLNPELSGETRWDWTTGTGTRDYGNAHYHFVIPTLPVPEAFPEHAWVTTDFSRCSAHLTPASGYGFAGKTKVDTHAPSARVLLSTNGRLFVELLDPESDEKKRPSVTLCWTTEFERTAHPLPSTKPPCETLQDRPHNAASGKLRVDMQGTRFKVTLPDETISNMTLVIKSPEGKVLLQSSPFDGRNEQTLGPTLSLERRATCELEGNTLVPRMLEVRSDSALLDQLQ